MADQARFDQDLSLRAIVWFVIGLVAVCVVFGALMWGSLNLLKRFEEERDPQPSPLAEAQLPHRPPEPLLQTDPEGELEEMRAELREQLTSFGWVDQSRGIAHVPVETAMEMIDREGLPVRANATASPFAAKAQEHEGH